MQVFQKSYFRDGCCVNRMNVENNENVWEIGMASEGEGMSCGVTEVVRHITFGNNG